MKILVTGGAGFIGSFLIDELIRREDDVRILDSFDPQVHSFKPRVNEKVELIKGDIRNEKDIAKSLEDVDIVFHQASAVGIGQSMYQISKYVDVNALGTAKLLDVIVNGNYAVKKMVIASSMTVYGEGSYKCSKCGVISSGIRNSEQMVGGEWELICPNCKIGLVPISTKEDKELDANNIYAITKRVQEDMSLVIGKTYGIPTVSLRYFNVYGPRQSLSNPYTGVAAIFTARIKNNKPPIIFEDGKQTRDFVSVHDVVNANILAMEKDAANYEIFNVGTGKATSVLDIAKMLIRLHGKNIEPQISGKFRKGDIRHCTADITKIKNMLGWQPKIDLDDGLKEFVEWSKSISFEGISDKAINELTDKGLLK